MSDADWYFIPTGDGKTVKRRTDPYMVWSKTIVAPVFYDFHHYEYGADGVLRRRLVDKGDLYQAMRNKAMEVISYIGSPMKGIHAPVVYHFLIDAEFCNRGGDPRTIFTRTRIEAVVAAARRLRGKEDLKQALDEILALVLTLDA